MRTLRTDIDINGDDTDVWYVPTGATTIWHRTLDNGVVVSDVDTGEPAPEPEPVVDHAQAQQVLALLAQLSPDQLQRVITLGVAVTEPAAVDTLVAAVAEGDAVTGVAVVADAAAAAQAAVDGG